MCLNISYLSVFLHESFECLHVEAVVHVWVPLKGWCKEIFISEADFCGELLVLLITVRKSWELSAFPREMTDEERMMEWTKEHQAI